MIKCVKMKNIETGSMSVKRFIWRNYASFFFFYKKLCFQLKRDNHNNLGIDYHICKDLESVSGLNIGVEIGWVEVGFAKPESGL